jgi:hypothetical protein
MADGADAAMMVDESTYLAALFGHVFAPDDGAVLGYVWCNKHGWVRGDETRVCDDCWMEVYESQPEVEMPEPHHCDWCGKPVVWADVRLTAECRFACDLADREGMMALTEKRQLIVMGRLCATCVESDMQWAPEEEWIVEDCEVIEILDDLPMTEEWGDRGERAVLETDSVATIAKVHFEGEGYITVYADMSNGRALTLFRYYEDELCFSSYELVGKTKAEALALFHEKDVAYLRS